MRYAMKKLTDKQVPVNDPESHGPPSFTFNVVELTMSGLHVSVVFGMLQQILQTSPAAKRS